MGYNMNTAITFKDIDLEITFIYTPPIIEDNTFGTSADVDIEEIFVKGLNIYELMVPHLEELEQLILEKICERT